MTADPLLRVVRLGGSLLTYAGLVPALDDWWARQSPLPSVVVVGGGGMVEALRRVAAEQPLPEPAAHYLAVRLMTITAQTVQALTGMPLVTSLAQAQEACLRDGAAVILDVETTMRDAAARQDLPSTWDVTSDSIAAYVAQRLGAAELVLLKSSLPPPGRSIRQLAAVGFVDRFFPLVAGGIPALRCVNLRDPELAECPLPATIGGDSLVAGSGRSLQLGAGRTLNDRQRGLPGGRAGRRG